MTEQAPETRSDWALRRLRSAILTGEFAPGTKLRAEDLAQRWAVSPTPLREAFQRLGGAGLIETTPQRGARVAEFSLADAADLYALRLELEPAALRRSVEQGDDAYRAAVAAAHARLERPASIADATDAHLAFHAALLAGCPSAWTRRIAAELAEHSQRYAILGAQRFRRGSDPRREHRALRDAVLRRRAREAERLLTTHLKGTLGAVHAALEVEACTKPSTPRRGTSSGRAT